MNIIARIRREPALIIAALGSVLTVLAANHLPYLSTGQAAAITTLLTAIAVAMTTHPAAPAMYIGVITAGFALVAEYGLHFPDDVVKAATAGALAVLALLGVRPQVSPLTGPTRA